MAENRRALIIGFSWSGKLASRILSEVYQEVVVFERDVRPDGPIPRKGIPQSHQPHVLLKKGEELLNAFFPNVTEELLDLGAVAFDFMKDVHWVHHGRQKVRIESHFDQLSLSRPLLEWVIQSRLSEIPNLNVNYETEVKDFIWDDVNGVKGVIVSSGDGEEWKKVHADLVVDCSGAASRFLQEFRNRHLPIPMEESLEINLAYTSQRVHLSESFERNWQALLLYPFPPESERGGILYPVENGESVISLFGYGGDHCAPKEDSFLDFAQTLSSPALYEAIKQASPLTSLKKYRVSKQYRRRMDKLHKQPEGLLVMGDALCRFDPVFGQGMTAACLEAKMLQDMIRESTYSIGSLQFNRTLYKRFMKRLYPLWLMVLAEDFRYGKTQGKKPFGLGVLQRYIYKIYSITETDPILYRRFARVLHLLDSPFTLFSPAILIKVLVKRGKPPIKEDSHQNAIPRQ